MQLGASYDVAKQSTSTFEAGNAAAAAFMNANPDEIGTQLLMLQADFPLLVCVLSIIQSLDHV